MYLSLLIICAIDVAHSTSITDMKNKSSYGDLNHDIAQSGIMAYLQGTPDEQSLYSVSKTMRNQAESLYDPNFYSKQKAQIFYKMYMQSKTHMEFGVPIQNDSCSDPDHDDKVVYKKLNFIQSVVSGIEHLVGIIEISKDR